MFCTVRSTQQSQPPNVVSTRRKQAVCTFGSESVPFQQLEQIQISARLRLDGYMDSLLVNSQQSCITGLPRDNFKVRDSMHARFLLLCQTMFHKLAVSISQLFLPTGNSSQSSNVS